jgi:hypothetical protein
LYEEAITLAGTLGDIEQEAFYATIWLKSFITKG